MSIVYFRQLYLIFRAVSYAVTYSCYQIVIKLSLVRRSSEISVILQYSVISILRLTFVITINYEHCSCTTWDCFLVGPA